MFVITLGPSKIRYGTPPYFGQPFELFLIQLEIMVSEKLENAFEMG